MDLPVPVPGPGKIQGCVNKGIRCKNRCQTKCGDPGGDIPKDEQLLHFFDSTSPLKFQKTAQITLTNITRRSGNGERLLRIFNSTELKPCGVFSCIHFQDEGEKVDSYDSVERCRSPTQ